MAKRIGKSSGSAPERIGGRHRFEHWYVSNQVYFISVRCRDRFPALAGEAAKAVFWDRFDHHTARHQFTPWVTSVVDNHYHVLGYCKVGAEMWPMMQRLHGSVAKQVNDLLATRRAPFWSQKGVGHSGYFDGCIRDEKQCRRAYRYVLTQCVRHGICPNWRDYRHTRVAVELDVGVRRALALGAFMPDVPYARYERGRASHAR